MPHGNKLAFDCSLIGTPCLGFAGENPKFAGHRDSDATATFGLLNSQRFLDKKFIKVLCARACVFVPHIGSDNRRTTYSNL